MSRRILHVLPTRASAFGGPVRVAEALTRLAERSGFEVEIFPRSAADSPPGRAAYLPTGAQARELWRAVGRAELVHIHGLWTVPTSLAAVMARGQRKPYVLTPHGMLDRWSLRRSAAKKAVYAAVAERRNIRRAAALHFFNEEEAAEARDFGALPPSFLLPNGVDTNELAALPPRAELERWLPELAGRRVALFLGRVHPKKGFDLLVPAFKAVRQRAPELVLVVAGPDEGGYLAEVKRLSAEAGVADGLRFVGEVLGDRKRLLLGGADFFVLPSHQEGDSVAIKEALAAGLPCLITTRCHFGAVERSGAGLVVEPAEDAVTRALQQFSGESAEKLRQRGVHARELAKEFDWGRLADRLRDAYLEILSGRSP